jgi:aspartate/tyrosine/aromatic aminotransferase
MFSLLNLSRKEIADLQRDRGIYIVEDGRINVAGLPSRRTTDFVQAVTEAPLNSSSYPVLERGMAGRFRRSR